MARITKAKQKILGINAPVDEMAAFGSCKTGAPVYTNDIDILQTEAYEAGWQNATNNDQAPYREEMNGVQYGLSRQIAYLQQEGIPEWISTVTYYTGSIVKVVNEGTAMAYQSLTDDNVGNNPLTDADNWSVWEIGDYANKSLTNLLPAGQAILDKKASVDLNNLSTIGQAILDKKVEVEALLAQNGYAKFTWKEGSTTRKLIVQWLYHSYKGLEIVLTLPTSFSNTTYSGALSFVSANTNACTYRNVGIYNKTKTTFTTCFRSDAEIPKTFLLVGY